MNTIISNNLKRTSERIDPAGNIIDARTKQIIQPVETPYIPTAAESAGTPAPVVSQITPISNPIDIQTQIEQAEAKVTELKELKRLKIVEMKKQLEALEQ